MSEVKELPLKKGNLIPSNNKTEENSPDFFGQLRLPNGLYDLSGWKEKSEKGNNYITLQVDEADLDIDDRKARRKKTVSDYKKEKKQNKDVYLVMDRTGSMHAAKDDAKEDLFGSVEIEGEKFYLKGYAAKSQNQNDYFRISVSDGLMDKDTRCETTAKLLD